MSFIVVTIIRLLLCVLTLIDLRAIFPSMNTTRGVLTVTLLTGLLVVAGCGSSRAVDSRVVNVSGSVGPLRVDRSGRVQVIAYAGKPDADLRSRGDSSRYEVLGYGCPRHIRPPRDYLIPCRTAFYVVRGKLGLFFTRGKPYSENHGVRIGMPTARAERLLRLKVYEGCEANLGLRSKEASLTIAFTGGRTRILHSGRLLLVGGHVDAFYLHSTDRDPGVTDCA
jgi:hypothetical protein